MKRPVIYCRIDLRTLATLGLFWNKQGLLPPTRALSELVHASLTSLQMQVEGKYPQMSVETIEEAIKHLRTMGFKLPTQEKSNRSIFNVLREEAMQREGMESIEAQIKGPRKDNEEDVWGEGMNGPSNEEFAEKERIKLQAIREAQEEAVQVAIDSGMIREPNDDNSASTLGNKSPKTE